MENLKLCKKEAREKKMASLKKYRVETSSQMKKIEMSNGERHMMYNNINVIWYIL